MANRFNYTGDYYVAVNGNDSNNGTSPETPFATIQAGIDAIGTQSTKTLVIGTGIYNESISTSFGGSYRYHIFQGDGDVIILGDNISDDTYNCAWGNGNTYTLYCTFNNIKFVNWHNVFVDPQANANYHRFNTYNNCTFINNWSIAGNNYSQAEYYNDCTFVKTNWPFGNTNMAASQNKQFTRCMFLKSPVGGNNTGPVDQKNPSSGLPQSLFFQNQSGNNESVFNRPNYLGRFVDCIFANPFDNEVSHFLTIPKENSTGNTNYVDLLENCVFSTEGIVESVWERYRGTLTERSDISHPFTQSVTEFVNELKQYGTYLAYDGNPYTSEINAIVQDTLIATQLNFNAVDLTGSTALEDNLGAPYNLNTNNTTYFLLGEHPRSRTVANKIPGLGYGTNDTGSNPFHTTGGATWSNIIATGSGLTISSSALISGTIESAVIDQGSSKTLQDIQFNWSINTSANPNDAVISYYTSSQGGYATPYTYQLRYSTSSANLSSEEYKVFPLNNTPYLDTNGSGSGDVNFITGSTNVVKARYLQFKLTLRNDWNG